jgi:hypothetical protein
MSDVPSNLIPTRVTQLPVAPVADENSLMMIVYQGNNYQIRVGDLLSVAGVPTSRQVIAGTGLQGGGQLSSNVTLSIANGGVGSVQLANSGVTPGSYGSATEIPVLTVDTTGRVMAATTIPATISGYVPESRQVIAGTGLSGGGALTGNVTLTANLSNATPLVLDGTGTAGVSTNMARADHQHPAVDLSDQAQINGILPLDQGGTARSLVADAGAIIWCGADGLYVGPVGNAGQVLVSNGTGEYTWGSAILVVDQPANVIYAGPAAGAAAPTTFRAMVNADLPNSGVSANTYGSSTAIPVITVNAKGVITSATTASFTGGLSYQGGWNASTNTPTLASGVGVNGYYYIVTTAGSTNLNGITDWQIGDWAIFNGTVWQKIDQTNLVASVNGQTGVVVLDYADVGAPSTSGTDATGTWSISVTGNAGTATNVAGGAANKIVYNTGSNTSAFIDAPTVSATFLKWTGSAFTWDTAGAGTVTSVGGTGTVSGISLSGTVTSSGNLTLGGALDLSAPPVIGGATPNTATFTTANATTFDTNVAAAGVTLSGTTLAADGTDTNITIQINPKGGGGVGIGGDTNGVVAGVPVTSKFCVKNDGDAPLAGFVHANNTTAGSGAATFACRSRGTIASPTVVQSGDTLWNMFVAGHDGTDLALAATISVQVDGTPGSNDMPARMVFSTTPDGSQIPAEAMRITSAQIVQIGTSDINGGTIDGTTIGASVAAAVTGTTITASTQFSGAGTGLTGTGSSFTAGSATNLAGGAASQIPYQTGSGATAFLANGTAGQVLLSNGASAPSWGGMDGGTF